MRAAVVGLRRLLLVAALIALLVGLGNRPAPQPQPVPRLDVVVAVDRTTSMSAVDDPAGSRLASAKRDLIRLGELLSSASFSLVTFGQNTQLVLPLTSDRTAYDDAVAKLRVEAPTAGTGSSVGRPVPFLTQELAAPTESDETEARNDDERTIPVLVLVSDGENTSAEPQPSFAGVGAEIDTGVVLGYGTEEGGTMPLDRKDTGSVVTVAATGQPALSHLDEANLTLIAGELGVPYVHADGTQDLPALAAQLEAAAYVGLPPVDPERELRWVWALLALVLVVPEVRSGWRQLVGTLGRDR